MKKFIIFFFLTFLFVQTSFAQVPQFYGGSPRTITEGTLGSEGTLGTESTLGIQVTSPVKTQVQSSYFFCKYNTSNSKLTDIFDFVTCLVGKSIIPLLFLFATAVFMWGVIQYVINSGEEKKVQGKLFMVWGIIALFVAFTIWGLVGILTNTFSLKASAPKTQLSP